MRMTAHRLASIVLATSFCSLAFINVGCGNDQENADSAASAKMAKADKERADAKNAAQLTTVQAQYDSAATDSSVSPEMALELKGRQAQLRYERTMAKISELRDKELAITRQISAIDQLASQIEGSQKFVEALKQYDPQTQLADLKARQGEIDNGQQWKLSVPTPEDPKGELQFPTISALQARIDALTAEIAENKAEIDAAHKASADASDQAETLTRKAETETGQKLVDDTTKASDFRKTAALADAQAESIAATVVGNQADLDSAQAQKAAISATSQTLAAGIENSEAAWKTVQEQINGEQKMQQKLISGGWDLSSDIKGTPPTIAAHAAELSTLLKDADKLRAEVVKDLAESSKQFAAAATDAQSLRTKLMAKIGERATDVDVPIWQDEKDTLHPTFYTLSQAAVQTSFASVQSNKAEIDALLEQMFNGYSVGAAIVAAPLKSLKLNFDAPTKPTAIAGLNNILTADKTGAEPPKELSDLPKPTREEIQKQIDDVNSSYADALKTFDLRSGGTDSPAIVSQFTTAAVLGKAIAERQWAEFDLLMGLPDADKHLHSAAELENTVPADKRDVASSLVPPASPAGGASAAPSLPER